MHLHNIIGYQDHQAPANGEINFAFLARYVRPETLLIIEAHHPASIGQIRQGKELLESLGYGKTKA
jgi:hypothetical protein